ncbi:MAG: hypothetical protein HWN51_04950 [Desulfobacterales bacterium]|nr:hypothetical protein [Desulfobacterales bacterium]
MIKYSPAASCLTPRQAGGPDTGKALHEERRPAPSAHGEARLPKHGDIGSSEYETIIS